jgi:hypothetical protein
MGISGLLKHLRSITHDAHAREFAKTTCVVDTYAWLHKGTYSCATELATGQPTRKYIVSLFHIAPTANVDHVSPDLLRARAHRPHCR